MFCILYKILNFLYIRMKKNPNNSFRKKTDGNVKKSQDDQQLFRLLDNPELDLSNDHQRYLIDFHSSCNLESDMGVIGNGYNILGNHFNVDSNISSSISLPKNDLINTISRNKVDLEKLWSFSNNRYENSDFSISQTEMIINFFELNKLFQDVNDQIKQDFACHCLILYSRYYDVFLFDEFQDIIGDKEKVEEYISDNLRDEESVLIKSMFEYCLEKVKPDLSEIFKGISLACLFNKRTNRNPKAGHKNLFIC